MTTSIPQSILVAAFPTLGQAERAVAELRQAGFRDEQVGLAMRECEEEVADALDERAGDRSTEGLAVGAVAGGILGAAVALLIPGLGEVVAWGILAITFQAAALGAAAGGLIGGLTGLGVSEDDARFCEAQFKEGRPILVVNADGHDAEVWDIIHRFGGIDRRRQSQT